MRKVFSIDEMEWQAVRGLPGARGFEYKVLSDKDYTAAFNSEMIGSSRATIRCRISSAGIICSISSAARAM